MKKTVRFLVADDDRDDLELFTSLLKEAAPDAVIIKVKDGTDVVAWLAECPEVLLPDALVMDYNMPKMNAAQVLDRICGQPKYFGLAKFILSTSSQKEYVDGCLKKGAIEYFIKSNHVEGLRNIAARITAFITRVSEKS
jgi:CheY-like chemotaxis protein